MLNRPLVLEGQIGTPDGAGGFDDAWTPLGTIWAELKAASGRETISGSATVARTTYRITVRAAPYSSPSRPRAGQRFRDGERVFSINAVLEVDPEGRFLRCMADEEIVS